MQELGEYVSKTYGPQNISSRKFGFLVREKSIAFKNSVIPDFIPEYADPKLFTKENPNPSTSERMKVFCEESVKISTAVSKMALEKANILPREVTHIITVTCTGLSAPGLEIQLTQTLSLQPDVVKYGINFMGCYAAFHAIRLADTIIKSSPNSNILIVCTELCSLHYRFDESDDNILSTYLFSDGCAAAVISGKEQNQPSLEILDTQSTLFLEGQNDMAWYVGNHGFEMLLNKNIPIYLRENLSQIYTNFLLKNNISKDEVGKYAIHPGGKNILKAFEHAIGITSEELGESYEILSECGNMSSATVLFVLEKMLYGDQQKDMIYSAAFGPGLTVESALFKKVSHEKS
jgi:predicted naringenin-chalcone synthase